MMILHGCSMEVDGGVRAMRDARCAMGDARRAMRWMNE